jgi:hypothetical protein
MIRAVAIAQGKRWGTRLKRGGTTPFPSLPFFTFPPLPLLPFLPHVLPPPFNGVPGYNLGKIF